MEHIRYKKETDVVTFQGKEITLENLSPVFTPEHEAAKRRSRKRQNAGSWNSSFMRCSASMPTNGRVRKPGHKVFRSHH